MHLVIERPVAFKTDVALCALWRLETNCCHFTLEITLDAYTCEVGLAYTVCVI